MSAWRAAQSFGAFFEQLAESGVTVDPVVLFFLWNLVDSFDFSPDEMDADDALILLTLAYRDGDDVHYVDPDITFAEFLEFGASS